MILSIKENGIGIKSENISKLFTITEKVYGRGIDNEEGTGLGSILCKEYTDKQNGKIWVKNEIGKGRTFLFILANCQIILINLK